MSIFYELKQQLSQQLDSLTAQQGWVALQAEIVADQQLDLLAWLHAQPLFPQSFWQSRNNTQIFATLGQAISFSQLKHAQQFSQQTHFTLFGGIKFEGQCQLILPRLQFAKKAEKLTACLYLNSDQLPTEKAQCQALLATIDRPLYKQNHIQNQCVMQFSASDFARWQHNIAQALHQIETAELRKVVLANATTYQFTAPLSAHALLALSQTKNLGCYHFLWAENAENIFIGSSPERLYQRQDRQFTTEALAGTVAVSETMAQTERNGLWLLSDQKNSYENQLVVEDICDHLANCISDLTVGEAKIKRLKNVQHLRRKIHATLLPNVTDSDCLTRIQPTAAVAGLPRQKAKQFIAQHEGFTRGWYAGSLGYFNPSKAEFCVTLRSALIEKNQITLYAGAGIVAGSDANAEWQEIERKALAMAGLLG